LLWRNGGEKLSKQPGAYWHDRPIHTAAFSGHPEVIETLVKLGASIHERQITNETALHIACQHGKPSVARKLLELGADPTLGDRDDMTPLHFAAQDGHVEIIPDLLTAQNGSLPAFLAMRCEPNGDTALHRAAICAFDVDVDYSPYVPVPAAIRDKTYLGCFKLLYKAGADVSAVNNTGETPLHLASTAGNLLIVNFILYRLSESERLKALALATLTEGHTPLHKAIIQGHSGVVRRLIEAGADPNYATADGDSTLQLAKDTGRHDIVQLLLSLPS
jgi:ankyrin repeat protein